MKFALTELQCGMLIGTAAVCLLVPAAFEAIHEGDGGRAAAPVAVQAAPPEVRPVFPTGPDEARVVSASLEAKRDRFYAEIEASKVHLTVLAGDAFADGILVSRYRLDDFTGTHEVEMPIFIAGAKPDPADGALWSGDAYLAGTRRYAGPGGDGAPRDVFQYALSPAAAFHLLSARDGTSVAASGR